MACTTVTRDSLIDYIKAVAIILVIITHCNFTVIQKSHVLFTYCINLAVPFFMLITGYNWAKSFLCKNISYYSQMFNIKLILKRFLRLTIPFVIILLLEYFFYHDTIMSKDKLITWYIKGGIGPGSYYYPVMLQILLLFPFIYKIISKYAKKGLLGILLFEGLLTWASVFWELDILIYRLLLIRFIGYIACGVYFAIHRSEINSQNIEKILFIGFIVVAVMVYGNNPNMFYPFIKKYWNFSSGLPILLFAAPAFYLILEKFKDKKFTGLFDELIQLTGKASWHIMLVQMFYFTCTAYVNKHLLIWDIIINLVICITLGIMFYIIDTKYISGFIKNVLKLEV